MVVRHGNAVIALDKVAAILFDENYAGQTNTILVFFEGVREGIPVKVDDGHQTFLELTEQLKKARGVR